MANIDNTGNKLGKILTRVILNTGVKCNSGKIVLKAETGNDAFINVFCHMGDETIEINFRKLKAIFIPNFDKAFHLDVLEASIENAIGEACEMLSITNITLPNKKNSAFNSLYTTYISMDGELVKWDVTGNIPILHIPDERKKDILNCIERSTGTFQFLSAKQNLLTFKFDKNESDVKDVKQRYNVVMYAYVGIKDVKINNEEVSFIDIKESGLITALKEEFLEDDDFIRYDAENCALSVLNQDLKLSELYNDEIFLNCYTYLTSVEGRDVNNFDEYGDKNITTIIDEIAEKMDGIKR